MSSADDDGVIVLPSPHSLPLGVVHGPPQAQFRGCSRQIAQVGAMARGIPLETSSGSRVRMPVITKSTEKRRRNGMKPEKKRSGTIRAIAGGEELNAIGLFPADCADGSAKSMHVIDVRPRL